MITRSYSSIPSLKLISFSVKRPSFGVIIMFTLFSSMLLFISSTLIFLVSRVTMKSFDERSLLPITCVSGRNERMSGTSSAHITVTLFLSFLSKR